MTILLAVLAGISLTSAVRNLAARGATQTALLDARGAPRREQLARHTLDLCVLTASAAVGAIGSWSLFGLFGLGGAPPAASWAAAAAVAAAAAGVVAAHVTRPPSASAASVSAGREPRLPAPVRTGADLALGIAAGVGLWQSTTVGLSTGSGTVVLVAAAPALATVAAAVATGRLISAASRIAEHVARRARRLPVRLAAWELARTPLKHLAPSLLCVAAIVGCGYCSAEHESWDHSVVDQAAFANGADVAVRPAAPLPLGKEASLISMPDVEAATPVETISEGDYSLVAIDARSADAVALRPDLLSAPSTELWPRLLTDPVAPLPGRPRRLRATLSTVSQPAAAIEVTATVEDATGVAYSVPFGDMAGDGAPHTAVAELGDDIAYPLHVVAVMGRLDESKETPGTTLASMTLTSLSGDGGEGGDADATDVTGWERDAMPDGPGPREGFVFTPPTTPGEVPVLATAAYLDQTGAAVGSSGEATVNGATVTTRIVGQLGAFPGTTASLVADTATLGAAVAASPADAPPVTVPTWWLRTASGEAPAGLPADAAVTTIHQTSAAALADPLSAMPQRLLRAGVPLLLVTAALGLIAAMTAAAAGAAHRDTVLAGLGTTRSQLAGLSCLLHTAVAAPAAALGAGLGTVVAALLVPRFVLAPDAGPPQPPAIVRFALPWSAGMALAVIGVVALASFAAAFRRGDPLTRTRAGD